MKISAVCRMPYVYVAEDMDLKNKKKNAALYCAVRCCMVLCCKMLYCAVQ